MNAFVEGIGTVGSFRPSPSRPSPDVLREQICLRPADDLAPRWHEAVVLSTDDQFGPFAETSYRNPRFQPRSRSRDRHDDGCCSPVRAAPNRWRWWWTGRLLRC